MGSARASRASGCAPQPEPRAPPRVAPRAVARSAAVNEAFTAAREARALPGEFAIFLLSRLPVFPGKCGHKLVWTNCSRLGTDALTERRFLIGFGVPTAKSRLEAGAPAHAAGAILSAAIVTTLPAKWPIWRLYALEAAPTPRLLLQQPAPDWIIRDLALPFGAKYIVAWSRGPNVEIHVYDTASGRELWHDMLIPFTPVTSLLGFGLKF